MSNTITQKVLGELLHRIAVETKDKLRHELDTQTNYLYIGRPAIRAMVDLHPTLRNRADKSVFTQNVYTQLKNYAKREVAGRPGVYWDPEHKDVLVFPANETKSDVVSSRVRPFISAIKRKVALQQSRRLLPLKMFLFGTLKVDEQQRQLTEQGAQNIHFGHVFGQAARSAELLNTEDNLELLQQAAGLNKTEIKTFSKLLRKIVKIDASLTVVKDISENKQKVIGILELADNNLSTGGKAGSYIQQVANMLADKIDIATLRGSKSAMEAIDDMVVTAFYDKPIKAYKNKSVGKASTKTAIRVRTKAIAPAKSIKSTKSKTKLPDLLTLTRQINAAMHDTLKQDVMGKGNATELLNYRTGRFAESVKVRRLVPSQTGKSMSADVAYMKNPYMVFSPIGRLHKPLRNPTLLAGRAIRIIMKDLAIQGLSLREVREVE